MTVLGTSEASPANLRRIQAEHRRRRRVCSSVSDAPLGSLCRNEQKTGAGRPAEMNLIEFTFSRV